MATTKRTAKKVYVLQYNGRYGWENEPNGIHTSKRDAQHSLTSLVRDVGYERSKLRIVERTMK